MYVYTHISALSSFRLAISGAKDVVSKTFLFCFCNICIIFIFFIYAKFIFCTACCCHLIYRATLGQQTCTTYILIAVSLYPTAYLVSCLRTKNFIFIVGNYILNLIHIFCSVKRGCGCSQLARQERCCLLSVAHNS